MAGLLNDNIVFPVLELIRREVKRTQVNNTVLPLDGEPSVTLYRNHPLDADRITGADMQYESGWRVEVYLKYGLNDFELPQSITPSHQDYDFYKNFILSQVTSSLIDKEGNPITTYYIRLNYDGEGRLTGTTVNRI